MENVEVLRALIHHCKEHSPLAVAFIDFAQAFNSVSREHVLSALTQIKVHPHVVGLVRQIYKDMTTSDEVGGGTTPDINLRVGIKQGDPIFSTLP